MTALQGKKTYIISALIVLYEVLGYLLGKKSELDIPTMLEGIGLATLRAGISGLRP